MAFTRPTLTELVDRVKTDIESRLTGGRKLLRRAVLSILARIMAGGFHLIYGYLDWIYKQAFPDTADIEQLKRWAAIFGVEQKQAEFSQGSFIALGTNGTEIPAGTEIQRADGLLYTTDALATISSGTATVAMTATVSGSESDTESGVTMTLVSPITGVNSTVTVTGADGITGGLDEESKEDLLARLLDHLHSPPSGGAENDYVQWALEVAGVTRAWCYPLYLGAGTVGVTFVRDDDSGTIIPSGGEVTEVQDYIDERRPVTADVTVFACTAAPLNFSILLTPATAAVKAAVQAELEDFILREAEPAGTLLLSRINEAISRSTGETDHTLSVPSANVTASTGTLTTMGTITWL